MSLLNQKLLKNSRSSLIDPSIHPCSSYKKGPVARFDSTEFKIYAHAHVLHGNIDQKISHCCLTVAKHSSIFIVVPHDWG